MSFLIELFFFIIALFVARFIGAPALRTVIDILFFDIPFTLRLRKRHYVRFSSALAGSAFSLVMWSLILAVILYIFFKYTLAMFAFIFESIYLTYKTRNSKQLQLTYYCQKHYHNLSHLFRFDIEYDHDTGIIENYSELLIKAKASDILEEMELEEMDGKIVVHIYDKQNGCYDKLYPINTLPKNYAQFLKRKELYAVMDRSTTPPKLHLVKMHEWKKTLSFQNINSLSGSNNKQPYWILAVIGVLILGIVLCVISLLKKGIAKPPIPNTSPVHTAAPEHVTIPDHLIDITNIRGKTEEEVWSILGEPGDLYIYTDDPDDSYNYRELFFGDLTICTEIKSPHYVKYICIEGDSSEYSFYDLYIGMPKSELVHNLNENLTLLLDNSYDAYLFTENSVTYRIDGCEEFIKASLENDHICKLEYLIAV